MSFASTYSAASINGYRNFETSFGVTQTIQPQDIASNMGFGLAVATNNDGSYIAVTSRPLSIGSIAPSSCYIFTGAPGSYSQQQKIFPTGNAIGYGESVALNGYGNRLVVSTVNGANTDVYIYNRASTTFSEEQVYNNIGSYIDIDNSGDYCIVGGANVNVFFRSAGTWSLQQKLNTSPAIGGPVSISADATYAISGNPEDDTFGNNRGAAYIYVRTGTTWSLQQKITFASAPNNSRYGTYVSISDTNDKIIISPSGSGDPSYYYTRSGSVWTLQQTIFPSPNTAIVQETNTTFTKAIAAMSSVGSLLSFDANTNTWSKTQTISSLPPGIGKSAINASGNIIFVGNAGYDTPATNIGIVYIYTL